MHKRVLMKTPQECADLFWIDGFVVIEDFFPPELMDHYNARILDHYGMRPTWEHSDEFIRKSATEVVPWFPYREGDNLFDTVNHDRRFNEVTDAILTEGWDALYCMTMFSKAGTVGQAWHQDCPPEDAHQFNLNRLIYTHDVNSESGGETLVVPGSFRKGELPKGEPHGRIDGQVVLCPGKGTVVFLHGHSWHRVYPIKGDYRISVNFRAIPTGTPEDITDVAVYRNIRYRFSTGEVIEER